MFYIWIVVAQQARMPGYNEVVVCQTPYVTQQTDAYGRPMVHPQTRQPLPAPNLPVTVQDLQRQGFLNPQLTLQHLQYKVIGGGERCGALSVLCCQMTPFPTVQRTQENAPFNQPVGNPGAPNDVLPEGTHGGWVQMPNSGLPSSADPVFGENNAYGGAYQNLDVNQGRQSIQENNDMTGVGRMSDTHEAAQQRAAVARQNAGGEVRPPWR